ncbi:hypothetical protein [Pseudomonas sp. GM74]|uniref:hypothetical protein n=1 Tax=Pseudomonas sp. GM74 TaxID=1144336 RepID=UPI001EE6712F|nr:hypothetical protein [Pseudomonas sp. GM74]
MAHLRTLPKAPGYKTAVKVTMGVAEVLYLILQRDFMMLNLQSYEILYFDSGSLEVSKNDRSIMRSPSLAVALAKLKDYKNVSKAEFDEMLSEYGLNPESDYDFLELKKLK